MKEYFRSSVGFEALHADKNRNMSDRFAARGTGLVKGAIVPSSALFNNVCCIVPGVLGATKGAHARAGGWVEGAAGCLDQQGWQRSNNIGAAAAERAGVSVWGMG